MVGLSLAETIVISRHIAVPQIHACINIAPIRDLSDPDTPAPTAADESGRSSQVFLIEVIVRRGDAERWAVARGRDIYAITAPIVVEATERVINGLALRSGVLAAGEAFDARDFLGSLVPANLTHEVPVALSGQTISSLGRTGARRWAPVLRSSGSPPLAPGPPTVRSITRPVPEPLRSPIPPPPAPPDSEDGGETGGSRVGRISGAEQEVAMCGCSARSRHAGDPDARDGRPGLERRNGAGPPARFIRGPDMSFFGPLRDRGV